MLVIRGEAGIGKSTLLEYAAEHADGFTILRAAGFEAEADLAFAGVYGLLRPRSRAARRGPGDAGTGTRRGARACAVGGA